MIIRNIYVVGKRECEKVLLKIPKNIYIYNILIIPIEVKLFIK